MEYNGLPSKLHEIHSPILSQQKCLLVISFAGSTPPAEAFESDVTGRKGPVEHEDPCHAADCSAGAYTPALGESARYESTGCSPPLLGREVKASEDGQDNTRTS